MWVVLIICLLLSLVIIVCLGTGSGVVYPEIIPAEGLTSVHAYNFDFPFAGGSQRISTEVGDAVYLGAKNANKYAVLHGKQPEDELLSGYYQAFISDPCQGPMYESLLRDFRDIRADEGLDDDEYLELITVFVQSLPYLENENATGMRFPVETIVEGGGDCDEKACLLLGLLSREGYNVSLLFFSGNYHVAAGVAVPGQDGYAYIETTKYSFVGVPARMLANGAILNTEPVVIKIGNGTENYQSSDEGRFLDETVRSASDDARILNTLIELRKDDLSHYIPGSEDYVIRMAAFNQAVSDYDEKMRVFSYISSHQYDRVGTYRWVQENEDSVYPLYHQ